ncbi:hypothetical protein [Streptomyces sp. 5-10]|uniref:hypothetical protein n=1 Tax=Streptomyces sp. 5-10 TaxID=878925 RepID=UPI00168B0F5D|nr:hypothetical protein [Streptomyces sp. 5-10]MBD3005349.1 hypothetical protein [Streptomyces sp. 5-10]
MSKHEPTVAEIETEVVELLRTEKRPCGRRCTAISPTGRTPSVIRASYSGFLLL